MLKQSLTKARVHKLQPPPSPGFFAVSTASCRPPVKAFSQLDCLIACIYTDYRQVTHTTALENWNMSWVSLLYMRSFALVSSGWAPYQVMCVASLGWAPYQVICVASSGWAPYQELQNLYH